MRGHFVTPPQPYELAVWNITTPDGADRRYRRQLLERVPEPLRSPVIETYRHDYAHHGLTHANLRLGEAYAKIREDHHGLPLLDEDEIIYFARSRAADARTHARFAKSVANKFSLLSEYAARYGLEAPPLKAPITLQGAVNRLKCEYWWRKQIRKKVRRGFETSAIRLGLVNKKSGAYVSDQALQWRRQQRQQNRALLESLVATNEQGRQFTLAELADKSVSHPRNRRNELMTRIAGFDTCAQELGHEAQLLTITCPSRMHAWSGDAQNPAYDGTTPREAQAYLSRLWAQIRAALDRRNIHGYGLRVAEPHKDGTPHWHLLVFCTAEQIGEYEDICRRYALKESPDEPGAQMHRFKSERIDRSKGSAVGYIAKYIAKNIDGYGLDESDGSDTPKSAAERVEAWASTWGIRQFQQIGGPPVTLWRALRRLDERSIDHDIRPYWEAADSGDWSAYVKLMGGPMAKRSEMPIELYREQREGQGYYEDPYGRTTVGVQLADIVYLLPQRKWVVQRKVDNVPPESTDEISLGSLDRDIWTSTGAVSFQLH